MKPARFAYARPQTLHEAVDLLHRHGSDAAILAGGQSLMPLLNLRMAQPAILIDINAIPGMANIERQGDRIVIGGRARHTDVLHAPLLIEADSLLVQAMPYVAHAAIRNRGTLGGSLALADPAAEMAACAVCLDADIVAVSSRGERIIPAAQFFEGLYSTALAPDELICRVGYPVLDASWRVAFDEIARRRGDFAMAALALGAQVVAGRIADCRIAFGGIETHSRRMTSVEAALIGQSVADPAARAAAADILDRSLSPLEGGEYSPAYRRQLARVLLDRLLTRIDGKARA
jgi:aerobic carbon-monoxide dehydrogenase medium subunit